MRSDALHIIYNGRDQFLKDFVELTDPALELSHRITDSFTAQSPICPLMGVDIKIGKMLGSGISSHVFEISFKNSHSKNGLEKDLSTGALL